MSSYARGARLERDVVKHLSGLGYLCMRSAGSHGLYDVAAYKPSVLLLVECKYGSGRLRPDEWDALYDLAEAYHRRRDSHVVPILATREPHGPKRYWEITGRKTRRPGVREPKVRYYP